MAFADLRENVNVTPLFTASAAVTIHRFVNVTGTRTVGLSGASGRSIGVALQDAAVGGRVQIKHSGPAPVEVGVGGVTAGAAVMSDATGRAVLAGLTDLVTGVAVETGLVGETVTIEVAPLGSAGGSAGNVFQFASQAALTASSVVGVLDGTIAYTIADRRYWQLRTSVLALTANRVIASSDGARRWEYFQLASVDPLVIPGLDSFSEGSSRASGSRSHAEGSATTASSTSAHSEGSGTTASGSASHAEGVSCTSAATAGHAEGFANTLTAGAPFAHVEGSSNVVTSGIASHTEGATNTQFAAQGHVEGNLSSATAAAINGHAQNGGCIVSGVNSHAGGFTSSASSEQAFAHGNTCLASGKNGVALGRLSTASGDESTALGRGCVASGAQSLAHGFGATAAGPGEYAHTFTNSVGGGLRRLGPFEALLSLGVIGNTADLVFTGLALQSFLVAGKNYFARVSLVSAGSLAVPATYGGYECIGVIQSGVVGGTSFPTGALGGALSAVVGADGLVLSAGSVVIRARSAVAGGGSVQVTAYVDLIQINS